MAYTVTWGAFPTRTGKILKGDADAGTEIELDLKPFLSKEAVRITIRDESGNQCQWPQWIWSTEGVLEFDQKRRGRTNQKGVHSENTNFPSLPKTATPARSFQIKDSPVCRSVGKNLWLGPHGTRIQLIRGKDVSDAMNIFPRAVATDNLEVTTYRWQNVDAWRISLQLDPAAHPGVQQLEYAALVIPLQKHRLLLILSPSCAAFDQTLTAFSALIKFKF